MIHCFTFHSYNRDKSGAHFHFIPPGVEDFSVIVEEYLEFRRTREMPAKVLFVGLKFALATLSKLLVSPEFEARKEEISGSGDCVFEVWVFDENGELVGDSGQFMPVELSAEMRTSGMLAICQSQKVVIETHASFHYVKPSGHHVDRFVRAANAMVRSAEVVFQAAWILRHMPRDFRIVHCDTSGISSVAHAALNLKFMFSGQTLPIAVTSFGSYAGLTGNALDSPAACLVLISATTSGSMAQKITKENSIPASAIVTLFYLGEQPPQGNVLCDLTRSRTIGGFEPARNQELGKCELCDRGSISLQMEGDGFWPEPPKVTICLVVHAHLPDWLHPFLGSSIPSKAVRCAVSRIGTDATDEIFIDARRLIRDSVELRNRWLRMLSLGIPAAVARIIYFSDDAASNAFAIEIQDFIKTNTSKVAPIFGVGRNILLKATELAAEGASVVAASAIVKGRRITSVSRDLRDSHGPIVYFAGVSRTESLAAHKRIRSNLVKSMTGVDHVLQVASEIYLPSCQADSVSSWACERRFLEEWSNIGRLPDIIANRLELLLSSKEDEERGFRKDAFLCDPKGNALRLRNNSIFIPKEIASNTVSQADVFFAVSAVLHKLRGERSGIGSLGRGIRHHALLDPANFERFTDGVIQAAFLRAALPIELDYAVDAKVSAHCLEFLQSMFRKLDAQGEAALEFAIAIATDRLKLTIADHQQLERQWGEDAAQYPDPLRALVNRIRQKSAQT